MSLLLLNVLTGFDYFFVKYAGLSGLAEEFIGQLQLRLASMKASGASESDIKEAYSNSIVTAFEDNEATISDITSGSFNAQKLVKSAENEFVSNIGLDTDAASIVDDLVSEFKDRDSTEDTYASFILELEIQKQIDALDAENLTTAEYSERVKDIRSAFQAKPTGVSETNQTTGAGEQIESGDNVPVEVQPVEEVPPPVPTEVANFKVETTEVGTVLLSWTIPDDLDMQEIRLVRKANSLPSNMTNGFSLLPEAESKLESFSDAVGIGDFQFYKMYVRNAAGEWSSGNTPIGNGVNPISLNPPLAFSVLGLSGNKDTIVDGFLGNELATVTWEKSGNSTNYEVSIRNSANNAEICPPISTVETFVTFADCTLVDSVSYNISIKAWSDGVFVTALNSPFPFSVSIPDLQITSPLENSFDSFVHAGNKSSIPFSGTCNEDGTGNIVFKVNSAVTIDSPVDCVGGNWSTTMDFSNATDGKYPVEVLLTHSHAPATQTLNFFMDDISTYLLISGAGGSLINGNPVSTCGGGDICNSTNPYYSSVAFVADYIFIEDGGC